MALRIGKSEWKQLRRHGEETYPNECCGVILGEIDGEGLKSVQAVVPCGNQRFDSLHNRYLIDPRELVRIQRQARERGQDIIGFYHSHPEHPARWSQTDLAEAHWTGCSYVITSVMNGRAAETNAFNLGGFDDKKRFEDEEIRFA
jgi:proteasome lid subunit RPN8/RPN11